MKKIDYIFGESSWDVECFAKVFGYRPKSYTHNDFFNGSNKYNTRLVKRVYVFIFVLFKSMFFILNRKVICYTSFNAEITIVAKLLGSYSKAFIFTPNFLFSPTTNSPLDLLFNRYKGKIFVSDVVTFKTLSKYKPNLCGDYFTLNTPDENLLNDMTYVVSLPAALSHKSTKNIASNLYSESLSIGQYLSKTGNSVFYLLHPRDENYTSTDINEVISSEDISKLKGNVCIISLCSSLSLNKRYGGIYGVWIYSNVLDYLTDDNDAVYRSFSWDLEDCSNG